jgi:hypothetical protein
LNGASVVGEEEDVGGVDMGVLGNESLNSFSGGSEGVHFGIVDFDMRT